MSNTNFHRIYSLCVKKIPLLVFNISFVFFLFGCSSNTHRAPVTSVNQPASSKLSHHIVAPGDTLYGIAWRYNLDYKNLAKINGISAPYSILPGRKLRLKGVAERVPYSVARAAAKNSAPVPKIKKSVAKPRSKKETKPSLVVKTQSVKSSPLVWSWPVKGKLVGSFYSGGGLNKGIDIASKLGEPVRAAADGEVVYAGSGLRGYGKLLIVKHKNSYLSAYAHNSKLLSKEGDTVKRNQKIAEVGGSGTNRAKLHFEIRHDGIPVDPLKLLPR